uniref:Uncharacterized protein n=1 Tax=Lepeophtheirus salmonis TaxID=72036 RepID=A0A0K2U059_LEPSM
MIKYWNLFFCPNSSKICTNNILTTKNRKDLATSPSSMTTRDSKYKLQYNIVYIIGGKICIAHGCLSKYRATKSGSIETGPGNIIIPNRRMSHKENFGVKPYPAKIRNLHNILHFVNFILSPLIIKLNLRILTKFVVKILT